MYREDYCIEKYFGISNRLSLEEFEFLAAQQRIKIKTKKGKGIELPKLELLDGIYGPFRPNTLEYVPLWLACFLEERDLC